MSRDSRAHRSPDVDRDESDLVNRIGMIDDPIKVLLIDDNEQWARFIKKDLQQQSPKLNVTLALSANEAILTIQQDTDFDCIVADYKIPEINGLQLLERVREERPNLPFILVTGAGSEDVASCAIDAGVSDYLIKNSRSDQTPILANKIETAVRQHRLQRAIKQSEDRYRTITEQSRDAIAIFLQSGLAFWNRRLSELTGRDDEELDTIDFVSEVIHRDDRKRMREFLERLFNDKESDIHEVRLRTKNDDIRHCEYTGSTIAFENQTAALVSIRDVTERKLRQRELAWERNLNRTVQEALIESRTREELEQAVARQLCESGYAMAWFGKIDKGQVTPTVIEGESTYIDEINLSIGSGSHDSEPSIWAVRSEEPKFVQNFTDLFSTGWQEKAFECGFNSGAAVPLTYNEVSYGILAVYHETADRFDETERKLLTELANTIAFAIHNIETEQALASNHFIEVTVQLDSSTYYLTELAQSDPIRSGTAKFTVHGTIQDGDGDILQYVELNDTELETFREAASAHPSVADVTVIDEDANRLQIHVVDPVPESVLATRGTVVNATTVRPSGATLRLELPARSDVRSTIDIVDEAFGPADVQSVIERDRNEGDDMNDNELTEKQAAALQAAYHHGYFEQPRKKSASEVADALNITHSTFLYHLRTAQQKIFDSRFA